MVNFEEFKKEVEKLPISSFEKERIIEDSKRALDHGYIKGWNQN